MEMPLGQSPLVKGDIPVNLDEDLAQFVYFMEFLRVVKIKGDSLFHSHGAPNEAAGRSGVY